MKTPLLLTLVLASFHSFSQNSPDSTIEKYCSVGMGYTWSKTITARVDSGVNNHKRQWDFLRDEKGEKAEFVSVVDALNYFGARGWKLVSTYPVMTAGYSETSYLFKKNVSLLPARDQ